MSCIVWAQRRVCKRHVTLGHGLEWRIKSKQTQIDLIGTRIRNGLVRRGRSLPSIFAARLSPPTCHLGDFRPFMYKMMHHPPVRLLLPLTPLAAVQSPPTSSRITATAATDCWRPGLFRVGTLLLL